AGVAQTVEQRIRNAKVEGSIPFTGTTFNGLNLSGHFFVRCCPVHWWSSAKNPAFKQVLQEVAAGKVKPLSDVVVFVIADGRRDMQSLLTRRLLGA
ncbi:MAG: hypothetical protein RJA77_928, partial [Pseudomonadota bacterium]